MTTVFSVVGFHHDDPDQLLLLGDDGVHYQYDVVNDATNPIEPDEVWEIDPHAITPENEPLAL